ncbi:MAG TPA: protein kinase [Gemmatimonadales bacterium]|nr:protein kinase [Gemmatimonadales bacterium]
MRCSRCGSDVPSTSRFCSTCGFDLAVTTPVRALATGEITDFDLVREALDGEYEVLEELGRGGMALVYRARDRQLDRQVAVKVLPFTFAFDAEFVERFQREARTSAQLEHPNIIPIHRVGQSGRVIYFVMKYLRGGSLASVLAERRVLSPPEIRRVLIDAGAALGYAAQRGVVHRDIKPDNIMFDEFGQSVLTDFGIAKAASGQRLTGTGMSIGTPHYMSPEQARAQGTDGRSDIYSLGVVAYQCLTGQVPYDGEDSFSIGYKHITEPLPTPPLASIDERKLFEVIRRMLAKDPGDRFQRCEDLVAALQADPVSPPGPLRLGAEARQGAPSSPVRTTPPPAPPSAQPTVVTPVRTPAAALAAAPARQPGAPARRIANRSPVMKQSERSLWPWVLVLLLIGGGATAYARFGNPFTPAAASESPAADPASPQSPASSLAAADSVAADSAPSTPAAAPEGAAPAPVPAPPPGTPVERQPTGSGGIRVRGIPAGSIVQIDQQVPSSAISTVSAGRHEIAISAPQHHFLVDTVEVANGETLDYAPTLVPVGARVPSPAPRQPRRAAAQGPCDPGPAYDATQCFDVRPRPADAPFLAPPDGVPLPERGTQLWVQVSAEGRTAAVRPRRSSGVLRFDRAAAAFAQRLAWTPALRGGEPVTAWVQLEVRPAPQ